MTRMLRFAVAILLALTMPASAQENPHSANSYMPGCRDFIADNWGRDAYQRGKCIGFIAGLIYEAAETSFCLPRGVTYEQGVHVVVAYIEARPQRMHESFGDLSNRSICCAMISSAGRDQPGAQSPVGRSNTVVRRYPDDPTDHRHGVAAHGTCLPFWRICTGS